MSRFATNTKLFIGKVGKLAPVNIGSSSNGIHVVNFNQTYMSYSNWSYSFKSALFGSGSISKIGFASGSGQFLTYGGLIIDKLSNEIISIRVRDEGGQYLQLTSNRLDTPKCPRKYKTFRRHWRVAMFNYLAQPVTDRDSRIKIVKTDHMFLQKFLIQFNVVPTRNDLVKIKKDIYRTARRM